MLYDHISVKGGGECGNCARWKDMCEAGWKFTDRNTSCRSLQFEMSVERELICWRPSGVILIWEERNVE